MRKFLALFLLLFTGSQVFAQSFPKPPDVPAYVAVSPTYAAGTTQNVLGDNSDAKGGTPPAFANMLSDIPTPNRAPWLVTGTYGDADGFCTVPTGTFNGHGCPEPKFRTHILFSHVLFDDPIRNYGQPGASHCHTFFGNQGANAYSTYASLRTKRMSTASGGQLNATAYWFPCVVKNVAAQDYAVKPDYMVVYYNAQNQTNALKVQRLPRGLRYVGGFPMDDPDDTQLKKEIAAANAQTGTAGRYVYKYNGVIGWRCGVGGTDYFALHLKNADGTDGFNGITPGNTCPAGPIAMVINFPECWDGVNFWSPGGYKHLRQKIVDNLAPDDHLVCPNGWYILPSLQISFIFTQAGASDYMNWRLSSDDGAASKLNSLPTCTTGYANAPCNDGGGTRTVANGTSFHTDWLGAWDDTTMIEWQTNCLGLLGGSPHQCEPSYISGTHQLNYGPLPDGRTVVTTNSYGTSSTSVMVKIGTVHKGPVTMHNHM